jgi:hypothetical protein
LLLSITRRRFVRACSVSASASAAVIGAGWVVERLAELAQRLWWPSLRQSVQTYTVSMPRQFSET